MFEKTDQKKSSRARYHWQQDARLHVLSLADDIWADAASEPSINLLTWTCYVAIVAGKSETNIVKIQFSSAKVRIGCRRNNLDVSSRWEAYPQRYTQEVMPLEPEIYLKLKMELEQDLRPVIWTVAPATKQKVRFGPPNRQCVFTCLNGKHTQSRSELKAPVLTSILSRTIGSSDTTRKWSWASMRRLQ